MVRFDFDKVCELTRARPQGIGRALGHCPSPIIPTGTPLCQSGWMMGRSLLNAGLEVVHLQRFEQRYRWLLFRPTIVPGGLFDLPRHVLRQQRAFNSLPQRIIWLAKDWTFQRFSTAT